MHPGVAEVPKALRRIRADSRVLNCMTSIAETIDDIGFAQREASAHDLVALSPKMLYVREAYHVHLIAQALDVAQLSPVLEVDYQRSYHTQNQGSGPHTRPRVDIWCPQSLFPPDRETYVEVKLAGLWGDDKPRIGTRPAGSVVTWWADDIYRLMTCADMAHCAFVLCIFGTASPINLASPGGGPPKRQENDADDLYIQLCTAGCVPNARGTVERFLELCVKHLGALVTCLNPEKAQSDVWFRPVVVEWLQDGPAKSDWLVL
jgi:hypothetical protein